MGSAGVMRYDWTTSGSLEPPEVCTGVCCGMSLLAVSLVKVELRSVGGDVSGGGWQLSVPASILGRGMGRAGLLFVTVVGMAPLGSLLFHS